jgi:hypothetical protein
MANDFTGLGSVFEFGSKIIDKIWPNAEDANKAKLAILQMQQEGSFKELDAAIRLAEGQMKINKAEADKGGLLNQWRPALGWVCVFSYFYNFVGMPLIVWCVTTWRGDAPAMIALDTTELGVLLAGMLGIGGMRSFDKFKGVASK